MGEGGFGRAGVRVVPGLVPGAGLGDGGGSGDGKKCAHD